MTSAGGLWFAEPPQAGQQPFFEIRETLYKGRSRFQYIEVYDTVLFKRMLVLDRMVQTTERDEFFYHESLVHPAMVSHAAPRRVLIIGGGDGGALRRALEHPVERVTMVEIDAEVARVSREYLPSVSAGAFDDPRADVRFEDGYAFVERREGEYDVIIVDAPDPIGPGRQLFSAPFYQGLHDMLAPDGIVALQSESPLLMATQTASTYLHLRDVFPTVRLYLGAVPAYPSAVWSFTLASKAAPAERAEIERRYAERRICTSYYSPEVHEAAFALPGYLRRFLDDSVRRGEPSDAHPFFPAAQGQTVVEPNIPD